MKKFHPTYLTACLLGMLVALGLPVFAQISTGEKCYIGTNDPTRVSATTTYTVNTAAGTVTLRTKFARTFVDNTYGTGAVGWPSGHTFSNLTGSDKLQIALYNGANTKVMEFVMDYISASAAAPSGYKSLGVTGGDGGMVTGSAANVLSVKTSMDENFNTHGYVLTTNSPLTDTNYTPNATYPNWVFDVWYEVVVNLSAFGPSGFGTSSLVSVHASPSKTGNNTEPVTETNSCTVSLGNYVWNDLNGNGQQNAGEPGIGGVTVILNKPNNTTETTVTNANGFYQFTNLPTGTYSVTFPLGLAGNLKLTSANAGGISDTADSDAAELTGTTHSVTLNVGANNNTLDAGYVVSNLGLGNQVFVDKNRSGLFDLGDLAMPNATVRLYRDNNNDNNADGAFIASTITDINGAYAFNDLAPGNYIVGVVLTQPYGITLLNGGDPDNNIDNDNNALRIVNGEARGNAISLSAGAEPGGNTNHSYDIGVYNPKDNPTGGQKCWGNANPKVRGTSYWVVNQNSGTVTIRTVFAKSFVDNTYGTGAITWPNGHTFSNLTGSDNLTWSLKDANGVEKLRFQQDYISASAAFPSGYGTLGFDGDGNTPTVGLAADVLKFSTSHDVNFNVLGNVLTVNSPATDTSYTPNPSYPHYIYDAWYEVTVKLSAFGAAGFGTVSHPSLHASPSKTGNNTEIVDSIPCPCTVIALAGPDKNLDCQFTSATIGTPAVAGVSYSWSPATGLSATNVAMPTASPAATTTYTVTTTATGGCTATDVVVVNVLQTPPTVSITGILSVCNGSTTTLTASGNGTLLWSTGSTLPSITVGAGTYTVTATNGACSSSSTVTVNNVQGTIGNYVWSDDNVDGLQNDGINSGLNGVAVQLWSPGNDNQIGGGDDVILQSMMTGNDNQGRPGYYQFAVCNSGNYYVKFPTTFAEQLITSSNQIPGLDGNSDIDALGISPVFSININGVGTAKDNNTIDAGYFPLKYIGNTVWFDKDQDGIQDQDEVGVAGITVALLDHLNRQIASTVTDAYGNYYFNKMLGGNYKIAVTLPSGYVFSQKDAGADNQLDSDVDPVTGISSLFNYAIGTIDLSLDAGIYVPTILTAEVGNRVWLDEKVNNVANGIQDTNETGVAGVTVTLYNAANAPVASTITDANGVYLFSRLAPGVYSIGFSLPIGYVFSNPLQAAGDTTLDSDADPATGRTTTFSLAVGQVRTDLDAGIHEQSDSNASLGNFVWNDVNNNGVQDESEPGVAGVTVTLYDQTGVNVLKSVKTDILGDYTFNDLLPGTYRVGFSNFPAGFSLSQPGQGNNTATDSDPNVLTGKTASITLLAGEVNTTIDAGIRNPQAPQGGIGNFVWFDRDMDGVQEATENGVGGVSVELFNNQNLKMGYTISNNEGFYIFNGLPAGIYYVRFSNLPASYKLTAANQGAGAGADGVDSDPDAGTGQTALIAIANNEVNLTVDAGLVSNTGRNNKATIGDVVWNDANQNGQQDPNELGVQGMTVTLYQSNGVSVITTTTTNSLGEYIFNNLDAGQYVVGFTNLPVGFTYTGSNLGGDDELDSDVLPASGGKTDLIYLDEGDINLTVDAGVIQNLTLGSIGDFVWNDVNQNGLQDAGEPGIPGVTVKLYNSGNTILANTTTDGKGAYQFTGLNPGIYQVEFSNLPAGYKFAQKDAYVQLIPNGLPNANDDIDSDADTTTGRTPLITVAAGQAITTIDAGLFTLRASLGDFVWEDDDNDGVQDSTEDGLSGITVTLYDALGEPVTTAVTNSKGGYNFVNLDPGTYSVGFSNIPIAASFSPKNAGGNFTKDSDPDQLTGRTSLFTLAVSEYNPTIDAGVHLPTGTGLGDHVWLDLDSDGFQDATEPGVPGVTVTLYDSNNVALRTMITDQNGAYSFNNLIPGTFKVGFSTLPTYYTPGGKPYTSAFTFKNHGGVDSVGIDNDADLNGMTGLYTLAKGQYNPTVDAGIKLLIPVPALDFRAFATLKDDLIADVTWKTDYEINTKLFEIERSLNGTDFTKIDQKAASGSTIGTTYYGITDDLNQVQRQDVVYYRIKMVDVDGKFSYSNTVSVKLLESDADILVYPSPFQSGVNVLYQTESATSLNIRVTDLNGHIVSTKDAEVSAGRNIITLDNLGALATGTYFVIITDLENGVNSFIKVTKQ